MAKDKKTCSFCGRTDDEANLLIAGLHGHICDICVDQAHQIVEEQVQFTDKIEGDDSIQLKSPKELKAFLDDYVIGQEKAKKTLSVAVYNHYKRINQPVTDDEVEIEKSNILMVGETGTGKTLLAKTIAKKLNVPFTIVDATVLTEAGYVGEDVESILSRLLQAADYNAKLAERGIVFIDEIDKVARKSDNPSITRDVSGEGVQQAMLKILEGSVVNVAPQGGRKHPDQKYVQINTKNILFIAGGAFSGIEKNIANRLNTNVIGFKGDQNQKLDETNLLHYVNALDLKNFGLIPELLGRLPLVTHLDPLDGEALTQILTQPKNALVKQYKKLFELDGITLDITPDAADEFVKRALELNLGARGLRSLTEQIFTNLMFNIDELPKEVTIDRAYLQKEFSQLNLSDLKLAS